MDYKLYAKYVLIAALAVLGTWAAMTIMHLQEQNRLMEERVEELKTSKVILEANQQLLVEEKEALENIPLR